MTALRHRPMLRPMSLRQTPIHIGLKELPPEGREFIYTRASGELNSHLKDLIGNNDFEVHLKITPQGNMFDLKGHLKTSMDLQCSLCAIDIKHPVDMKLHEFIVINKPLAKGDLHSRANHVHEWEPDRPDSIILETDTFDVAEYVHEVTALAEPTRPLGKPDCEIACENRNDKVERSWLSYGKEPAPGEPQSNPFQVLEKFKLKS